MPCVICTDRFDSVVEIAQTKCGHVFHFDCVSRWIDHSETCPECRGVVYYTDLSNLYINFAPNDDAVRLRIETWKIKTLLEEKDMALIFSKEKIKELQLYMIFKNLDISRMQDHLRGLEFEYALVRAKVGLKSLPSLVTEIKRLKQENKKLVKQVARHNKKKKMTGCQNGQVPPKKKRRVDKVKLNKKVKESQFPCCQHHL
ncbi:e3 ubiquitin-protein ligase TRAIP [Trichonephila clavata]|uniref:E3 ubiquitin-protein ligase TRAIP n=1 Tax=Trichonephila clavata TaxID=2740835 RepID=A0A8X6LZ30_TRICU|nr:e3 ubiquitin-protein ligase TRAIP [Trichonephila clavata]